MFGIDGCGEMVNDRMRVATYEAALAAVVKPGAVVVDIGTGTGILAMMACRHGARRVYAIEPDSVIHLAREIVAANGFADRIEFFQAASVDVVLPERADVIVSDLHGALPLFRGHLPAIIDARTRFLVAGGVQIPRKETLHLAVAEAPHQHEVTVAPWLENPWRLDLRAGHAAAVNLWLRVDLRPEDLLTDPVACGTIDYRQVSSPDFSCEARMAVTRKGAGHGICMWFDADFADRVAFTTAPAETTQVFGQGFFRWPGAVALERGDNVAVRLAAKFVDEDYVWSWQSEIAGADGRTKERFRQSTFLGAALSRDGLRRAAAGFVPVLAAQGEIDRCILALMDGRNTSGDIAAELARRFPRKFATVQDALRQVSKLADRYAG